jgi:hypothetical protein
MARDMPSVNLRQHKKMGALAGSSNPKERKVGKEFLAADKRAGKFQKRKKR